jgi:hypothetical protein
MLARPDKPSQSPPITPLATVRSDFIVVCVLSLLGLTVSLLGVTLSDVVLSSVSSETIGIMFSQP